ncbi:uncharacterized protein LOC108091709 [Drosophila ficusphila]|uniref:uncharacterized protein LOC108091709 n=1 Tax=Drosophila ficusphila TaxID=30025 RepID=UPI0007E643B2|nr:uncharacterized protein LOC108091709 [Drosophila ficusphila]
MKEKKKNRIVTPTNLEQPGPSHFVSSEESQSDIENQAIVSFESGVPFILVDGLPISDRYDLEESLYQMEEERMKKVTSEIENNPGSELDDVEPPSELDLPIILSAKALAKIKAKQDEIRFQEDLRSLRISRPEDDEEVNDSAIVPESQRNCELEVFLNESKLLLQTTSNLEQIRCKLEQLKNLQEQIMMAKSVHEVEIPSSIPERPSIRRQATFDIKRDGDQKGDHPEVFIDPADCPRKSQSLTREIPTIQRSKGTFNIPNSVILRNREKSMPTEFPKESLGTQQIISQIGNLLMKLQLQRDNSKVLEEGSSYSYMVTIKPAGGNPNCSVHAITSLKSREVKPIAQPQNLRPPQAPLINVFTPANTMRSSDASQISISSRSTDGNSFATMSLPEPSSLRVKSPYLRKRPCSFLKVPAPARYCHGRKRD